MKAIREFELIGKEFQNVDVSEFVDMPTGRVAMGGLLNVYPEYRQTITGFGGAFTESSAYLYSTLSPEDKANVMLSLFGRFSLRYNYGRLCIGSSDFCLDEYSYIDEDDFDLHSFSIKRDFKYVIPFIKDVLKTNPNIIFFASPWSPPKQFKDNTSLIHGGCLLPEYYDVYAEYIIKYIEAYKKEGINIQFVTLQNEPNAKQTWESCAFDVDQEIAFCKVLYKHFKDHQMDTKIVFWDHNKGECYNRAKKFYSEIPDLVYGLGYHWYDGEYFEELDLINKLYPDKFLMSTEFCNPIDHNIPNQYGREILGDLKNGSNAIVEWNLILDQDGKPYHNRLGGANGGCSAPIIIENGKVTRTDNYFQMYMFSHFIDEDSRCCYTSSYTKDIEITASVNKENILTVNVIYSGLKDIETALKIGYKMYKFKLKPNMIKTIIIEL